ncbi:MAG: YraN family protein [Dehalococcoidales bacterium]|nr:YraN family protein [Dehalococcoidales bacterium]
MKRKATGSIGEKLAGEFLTKQGYEILETNYRCKEGEVDIIAKDSGFLVFVEVRAKTGCGFGSPEESVTTTKKEHLKNVAARYQETHGNLPQQYRIDFVAIELDRAGKPLRIEVIKNAVEEN